MMRRVGTWKTVRGLEDEIAVEVSLSNRRGIKTGAAWGVPGGAWRVPADWPGGVRQVGDVSLVCCSRMERGKVCPGTASLCVGARGSVPSGLNPRGAEYRSGVRWRTGS